MSNQKTDTKKSLEAERKKLDALSSEIEEQKRILEDGKLAFEKEVAEFEKQKAEFESSNDQVITDKSEQEKPEYVKHIKTDRVFAFTEELWANPLFVAATKEDLK